jgi:hypothetical protein
MSADTEKAPPKATSRPNRAPAPRNTHLLAKHVLGALHHDALPHPLHRVAATGRVLRHHRDAAEGAAAQEGALGEGEGRDLGGGVAVMMWWCLVSAARDRCCCECFIVSRGSGAHHRSPSRTHTWPAAHLISHAAGLLAVARRVRARRVARVGRACSRAEVCQFLCGSDLVGRGGCSCGDVIRCRNALSAG